MLCWGAVYCIIDYPTTNAVRCRKNNRRVLGISKGIEKGLDKVSCDKAATVVYRPVYRF